MNQKISRALEVLIGSIHYLILSYALTNMVLLFWRHWLFIFFFTSECWLMDRYLKRLQTLTGNKVVSAVIWILCFAIHMGIVYFFGRVVGEILPFSA